MSPTSNRSGSNTPLPGAPAVPSMLPVTQGPRASGISPMDTLNALRSRKALCAASLTQATDASTAQEVKALRAQLKATQLTDAHFRSKVEKLEGQLKQFETLPAQLAALQAQIAQQGKAAAKRPSLDDVGLRPTSLENGTQSIDSTQFASLQSEVQAMKTEANKLEHLPHRLQELEATIKRQGEEIAETFSNRIEIDGIVSVKEDVKAIKAKQLQGQVLNKEAVRSIVKAVIQPDVARWEAMRNDQSQTVQDLSAKVNASEKTIRDVSTRVGAAQKRSEELFVLMETDRQNRSRWEDYNLSELKLMQGSISQVESDKAKTYRTTATLETDLRRLFDQHKDLSENIIKYIGPIDKSYTNTDHTIIERIGDLEAKSRVLQKEQHDHSGEVASIWKIIDRCPVDPKDVKDLQETVCSLGEEKEQLAKDVHEMTAIIGELQRKSQAGSYKPDTTSFAEEIRKLSTRVTQVEAALRKSATPMPSAGLTEQSKSPGLGHIDTVANSSTTKGFEQRLRSVEIHIGGTSGLSKRCDKMQSDIEKVENNIHNYQSNVNQVQQRLVNIFGEIFDPFKASVEDRFEKYNRSLTHTDEGLADLQMQAKKLRIACPAAAFSASQLALIRDMIKAMTDEHCLPVLRDCVHREVEQRSAAVEDLKQQMAGKQDVATAKQNIDGVKAALRSLQSQYDNISTDDLHRKMVHWFTQNYPGPSANLLQQFAAIQHEITQIRNFTDAVTRIPNSAQALSKLAQLSPQLVALVQPPLAATGSLDTPAKTSELLRTVSDSVVKAQKQHDSLAKLVTSLQASMHSLNSTKASFVKEETLAALKASFARFQAELKVNIDQELRARKWIETSVQDLAKKVEEGFAKSEQAVAITNEKLERLENGQTKKTAIQVGKLQHALDRLHSDFGQALDLNNPKIKEFFECLPTLFSHVGQMQWVLEDLSRRTPQGPSEINWHADWKGMLSVPPPLTDGGDAVGKAKGRNKRQA